MFFHVFLQAFAAVAAVLSVSFLLGALWARLAGVFGGGRKNLNLFWTLFSGWMLLVSIYAVMVTGGATILLPLPLLLIVLWRHLPEQPETGKGGILLLALAVVAHLLFFCNGFLADSAARFVYVNSDLNIYLRTAVGLNASGIEQHSLDPAADVRHSASLYHYGDLWFYALLHRAGLHTPGTLYIVSFTVWASLFVLGLYSYIRSRFRELTGGRKVMLLFLVCGTLFTGFAFMNIPLFGIRYFTDSLLNYPKILLPALLIIALVQLALYRSEALIPMTVLALAGGLLFINVLPALYASLGLFVILLGITGAVSWKRLAGIPLAGFAILLVFLYLFYRLTVDAAAAAEPGTLTGMPVAGSYLRTAINIFIGGLFQWLTLLPYLAVIVAGLLLGRSRTQGRPAVFREWRRNLLKHTDLFLLPGIFLAGLGCWALLYPVNVDSIQFFSNVMVPVFAILIALGATWIFTAVKHKMLRMLMAGLLVVCIFQNRNYTFSVASLEKSEWESLQSFFAGETEPPVLVTLQSEKALASVFSRNTLGFIPLPVLNHIWAGFTSISLNPPFLAADPASIYAATETALLEQTPFSRYVRAQPADTQPGALIEAFIADSRAAYAAVSKDTVLPAGVMARVRDSVRISGPGWTIYRLDTE